MGKEEGIRRDERKGLEGKDGRGREDGNRQMGEEREIDLKRRKGRERKDEEEKRMGRGEGRTEEDWEDWKIRLGREERRKKGDWERKGGRGRGEKEDGKIREQKIGKNENRRWKRRV